MTLFHLAQQATETPPLLPPYQENSSPILRGLEYIGFYSGLPITNFQQLISRLVRLALSFVGIILFLMILYSGLIWMTARGDEEKIAKAKSTFAGAIIGLIIIISSYAIVVFIVNLFQQNSNAI